MKTRTIQVRLEEKTYEKLKQRAIVFGSTSEFIRFCVEKEVNVQGTNDKRLNSNDLHIENIIE